MTKYLFKWKYFALFALATSAAGFMVVSWEGVVVMWIFTTIFVAGTYYGMKLDGKVIK